MGAFNFDGGDVIVTTSHAVSGREVTDYLGIVVADVTPGRNVGKDLLAGVRDMVGGRSRSWENTLQQNQETALSELVAEARTLGADAVIAVGLEDESLGGQGGMMNIKAVGTAVRLR